GTVWLLVRAGWAALPAGAAWRQVLGVSLLCGIGFTMSLFIGGLAFEGHGATYDTLVKLGVLCGSLIAGVVGTFILVLAERRGPSRRRQQHMRIQ
ncbi:MAG TPA: Na+/H+ antiporter NhaA, partial [Rhizobacter sp.]|nr:Na+/H+ antiporter NhaA [Rhizobacter sp.]